MENKKMYGVKRVEDQRPEFAFYTQYYDGIVDTREEYGMLDQEHYIITEYEIEEINNSVLFGSKDYLKVISRKELMIKNYSKDKTN